MADLILRYLYLKRRRVFDIEHYICKTVAWTQLRTKSFFVVYRIIWQRICFKIRHTHCFEHVVVISNHALVCVVEKQRWEEEHHKHKHDNNSHNCLYYLATLYIWISHLYSLAKTCRRLRRHSRSVLKEIVLFVVLFLVPGRVIVSLCGTVELPCLVELFSVKNLVGGAVHSAALELFIWQLFYLVNIRHFNAVHWSPLVILSVILIHYFIPLNFTFLIP